MRGKNDCGPRNAWDHLQAQPLGCKSLDLLLEMPSRTERIRMVPLCSRRTAQRHVHQVVPADACDETNMPRVRKSHSARRWLGCHGTVYRVSGTRRASSLVRAIRSRDKPLPGCNNAPAQAAACSVQLHVSSDEPLPGCNNAPASAAACVCPSRKQQAWHTVMNRYAASCVLPLALQPSYSSAEMALDARMLSTRGGLCMLTAEHSTVRALQAAASACISQHQPAAELIVAGLLPHATAQRRTAQ